MRDQNTTSGTSQPAATSAHPPQVRVSDATPELCATPESRPWRAAAKFPPPPSSVPAPNFAGEPLLPPVGAQEQPPGKRGGFFSLDPYKKYFDVDTADVLYRLRLACVPVGSRFMETVQENPDLCVRLPLALLYVGMTRPSPQVRPVLGRRDAGVPRSRERQLVHLLLVLATGADEPGSHVLVRRHQGVPVCCPLLRLHHRSAAHGASK